MTTADLIFELWRRCRNVAGNMGHVDAEVVQELITKTREVLTSYGCSKRDADSVLHDLYVAVHWDWPEPTARIFETLLEIELQEFFRERMDICNP